MKFSLLPRPARHRFSLCLSALFLGLLPAAATIDVSLQMLLGNPSGATADPNNHDHYLIQRTVEAIDYNDALGVANWASWHLTWSDWHPQGRTGSYAPDTNLPPTFYKVTSNDYTNSSNYDRGHLCPSGDRTANEADNQLVFYLSNFIPQAADNNQGVWNNFEGYCRSLSSSNELLITCGPSGFNGTWLPSGKVAVPQSVWKVVVVVPTNDSVAVLDRISTATRVIAIKTPNTNGLSRTIPWQTFLTSANQIQADTGYTFFTALPANIATVLRAKVDGQSIPAPSITSFFPANGVAGTQVVITGTNFDSTIAVAFHDTSAPFTVNSSTQITTTVPPDVTTGPLTVTTGGGTAFSASNFTLTTDPVPDLTLTATHTGDFTQGDPSDVYTLVITNIGSADSAGTVTLTDTLPAGLTATALSGAGWTVVSLSPPTCTRSDALPPGASYPPVTLTVSVSASAAASVTNLATVSGGGDSILGNNSASDPTTILAAGAPIVTTGSASAVTNTTATLTGTVNPNNQPGTAWFEYGLTTSYGSTGLVSGTLTGNTAQPVSLTLAGLNPNTTYHFRLTATNLLGASTGLDQAFTTSTTLTTLAGWDVSTLTNQDYGPSPFPPTTNAANLTVGGLTRGSGVAIGTGAASRAWGGLGFQDTSSTAAISANRFATFTLSANAGYTVSFSSISRFDYRRSSTGPVSGLLQYQVGSGAFTDVGPVSYPSTSSSGASLSPMDLSGISALQSVEAGIPVTFRIVNWGGASGGTWYIFDVAKTNNADLEIQGMVSPVVVATPDLAVTVTHTGTFTQGDTGATCTILVTNLGTAATTGTITVTNLLPAGLAATALGGTGWTPNLANLTCTRSDALAAGAAYPPITVTVNVAINAPATLTNTVIVSGGGDTTPANNTASDAVTVIPLTPIQAWRLQWFGTPANSGVAADGAIPASDGLPNLVKYALGLDPLVPATNPVVGDIASGYLRLTSPKNPGATDVVFSVEASGDVLTGWATNGTVVDQNTATLLKAHDTTPVSAAPERFLRLRVSRP